MSNIRKERANARAPIVELEDVFTNEELGQLGEAWLSMDPEDSGNIPAPVRNIFFFLLFFINLFYFLIGTYDCACWTWGYSIR